MSQFQNGSAGMFDIASITSPSSSSGVESAAAIHHDLGHAPFTRFWQIALCFSGSMFTALLVGNVPIFGQIKFFLYVTGAIYIMLYKNPNIMRNWQPRVALIAGAIAVFELFIHTINLI